MPQDLGFFQGLSSLGADDKYKATSEALAREQFNVGQDFLDPNSQIYRQYGQQLQERLNAASPTLSTLLGFQSASGIGGQAGTSIANEQRQSIEARNRSAASSGQTDLYTQLAQTGAGLLGQSQQSFGNLANLQEQQRQFNESQPTFGEELFKIGSGLAGSFLGGGFLGSQFSGGGFTPESAGTNQQQRRSSLGNIF